MFGETSGSGNFLDISWVKFIHIFTRSENCFNEINELKPSKFIVRFVPFRYQSFQEFIVISLFELWCWVCRRYYVLRNYIWHFWYFWDFCFPSSRDSKGALGKASWCSKWTAFHDLETPVLDRRKSFNISNDHLCLEKDINNVVAVWKY